MDTLVICWSSSRWQGSWYLRHFKKPDWFSGLLGSITKTANVNDCPGKCLHALASLLCEEVREDIACPSSSMRCCVDRRNTEGGPTNDVEPETTTKYRLRPLPVRTTTTTTTTTIQTTTKRPQPAIASDKQDKYGDYEYTDGTDNDSLTSASRSLFSMTTSSAFFVCTSVCIFFQFI